MQAYAFTSTPMTVLIPGSETKGAFAVRHVIKPSGSSTPPHSHDRMLELSYVLSGTLSAETEGRVETRNDGEVLVLPPGRPHRLFNESGGTVRALWTEWAPWTFLYNLTWQAAVTVPLAPGPDGPAAFGPTRCRAVSQRPGAARCLDHRASEP